MRVWHVCRAREVPRHCGDCRGMGTGGRAQPQRITWQVLLLTSLLLLLHHGTFAAGENHRTQQNGSTRKLGLLTTPGALSEVPVLPLPATRARFLVFALGFLHSPDHSRPTLVLQKDFGMFY